MAKDERFAGEDFDGERRKGTCFGTLWMDSYEVDGDVTLTLEFCRFDPIVRADILSDVIGLLTREYETARKEIMPYLKRQKVEL